MPPAVAVRARHAATPTKPARSTRSSSRSSTSPSPRTRSTADAATFGYLLDRPADRAAPSAALRDARRGARCRGDRRHARGERSDQGDGAVRRDRACSRSPTTPASRSTRSTVRPGSTRPATRASDATYADNVAQARCASSKAYTRRCAPRGSRLSRSARWPDGHELVVRGEVEGVIAPRPAGDERLRLRPGVRADRGRRPHVCADDAGGETCDLAPGPRLLGAGARAFDLKRTSHAAGRHCRADREVVRTTPGVGITAESTPESAREAMNKLDRERCAPATMPCTPSRTSRSRVPAVRSRCACSGRTADRSLPVLVWFHGGGWVLGSARDPGSSLPPVVRRIAGDRRVGGLPARSGDEVPGRSRRLCRGVALGRLARGRARHRPHRIAVGGDSAGGNLAAVTALDRERRRLPVPAVPVARVPRDRPRVRAALDGRQRDRATSSRPTACAGSSTTTRGLGATTSPTGACRRCRAPDLFGPAARDRDDRRVRPASRSGRGLR